MPRPTRPELRNNAIAQLRQILAPPLGKKHLSQDELSTIVDIPLNSLRSVECGRLPFSPLMRNRIMCETGAVFDDRDECWRFWKPNGPKYSREHYLKFRELLEKRMEGIMARRDIFFASLRIKLLLEALPPKKRFKFLFRLNSFLETNRKEFCPGRFAELFDDACGFIEAYPELDRDHPMFVTRGYPERLIRHVHSEPPPPILAPPQNIKDQEKFNRWFEDEVTPVSFDQAGYEKSLRQPKESHARMKRPKVSSAGE